MEGYFPIEQYCKLTGISKDTAHHRYLRKTVDGFKNDSGRCFLYFSDESDPVPEGFVHSAKYAKKVGVSLTTLRNTIKHGLFDDKDVIRLKYTNKLGRHFNQIYIRSDCEYPNNRSLVNKRVAWRALNASRPKGYLTVMEFAEREKMSKQYIYNSVYGNHIQGVKQVNGHWYIPETSTIERKWKNHDYQAGRNGNKS